ncbi:MAG: serine/threonine protein kinase with repeat [Edaphobacter sp.]|nr:serine/threonine protein kinase with repeat [Edaphobacter sp.]
MSWASRKAASLDFFGAMYPVYVRGQAYLALHQGAQAAMEFQKIIDHREIVISDPVGALAHLQLGRAYLMAGDQARAKAAYSDFLSLWKAADSSIPVLQQARLEYARLD